MTDNRCDICGRFRPWHELYDEEHPTLDELGGVDLNEERLCIHCEPLAVGVSVPLPEEATE